MFSISQDLNQSGSQKAAWKLCSRRVRSLTYSAYSNSLYICSRLARIELIYHKLITRMLSINLDQVNFYLLETSPNACSLFAKTEQFGSHSSLLIYPRLAKIKTVSLIKMILGLALEYLFQLIQFR